LPSKHLPGALFTETLDVDCICYNHWNKRAAYHKYRFLIKFEILKAFTSYQKPLPTIKHRLLSLYPDWEELIWEKTDPKKERLAVLEALMKTYFFRFLFPNGLSP